MTLMWAVSYWWPWWWTCYKGCFRSCCTVCHLAVREPITVTSHECHGVATHRQIEWISNSLFRPTSKTTPKPALLTLCHGNPPMTGGFPSQRASNTVSLPMSLRHYVSLPLRLQRSSRWVFHSWSWRRSWWFSSPPHPTPPPSLLPPASRVYVAAL